MAIASIVLIMALDLQADLHTSIKRTLSFPFITIYILIVHARRSAVSQTGPVLLRTRIWQRPLLPVADVGAAAVELLVGAPAAGAAGLLFSSVRLRKVSNRDRLQSSVRRQSSLHSNWKSQPWCMGDRSRRRGSSDDHRSLWFASSDDYQHFAGF